MKYKGIDLQDLDPSIEMDAAKSFIEHREINKKKLTQRAFSQAMKTALQAFKISMTPTELIDFTVNKGWAGININWTLNALNSEMIALERIRTNTRYTQPQQNLGTWVSGGVIHESVG